MRCYIGTDKGADGTAELDGIGDAAYPIDDDAFPVVVGSIATGSGYVVTTDVEVSVDAFLVWVDGTATVLVGTCGLATLEHTFRIRSGRTGFVVVVHNVMVAAHAAVSAVTSSPVIHEVVAQIHLFCHDGTARILTLVVAFPSVAGAAESWSTVLYMAYHVVMERCSLSTPYTTVAVLTLGVTGVSQSFTDGTPLHGEVAVIVE